MKKLSYLMIAALFMAACSNNDELLNNENLNGKVTVTATLPSDAPDSRVALTEATDEDNNPIIKVSWADTESFSVIRGSENVTYSKSTEGNTFTGDAHITTEGTYYAFYPANETAATTNAMPYDLSEQTGALEAAKTYMYANGGTEGTKYDFKHLTALVKFTLALPDDAIGVTPTKVVIRSNKLHPVGTVDLTAADVTYTASEDAATSITITPNEDDASLVFYAYVTPMSSSESEKNTFIINMEGSDGKYYNGTLVTSVSIAANYLYTASVDMIHVKKGSLAMKNGSFKNLTATEISDLSPDEKNEVAGIVFWTVNDEGSSTLVGDNAADKIMQTDFPHCTHGLIVALTNVHEDCAWQNSESYESVANWQNENTTYAPSDEGYKSIASQCSNDDNIKYILGYQNTKLLKAYNESLSDDESGKMVLPVSELAIWEDNNPAPANTTGWFIPSAKELHMLCYKDVSGLLTSSTSNTTHTEIDPLIEALGGKKLSDYGYYWSSSECAGNEKDAFGVLFNYGSVDDYYKYYTDYVRAVCAY